MRGLGPEQLAFQQQIQTLPKFQTNQARAERLLSPHEKVKVLTGSGEEVDAIHFWRYLAQKFALSGESLQKLLTEDGKWKYKIEIKEEVEPFLHFPPDEFLKQVLPLFEPLYEFVQAALNENAKHPEIGLNDHQLKKHILRVAEFVIQFYKSAKDAGQQISNEEINLTLLGVLYHDAGNAFDRKIHPFFSGQIYTMTTGVRLEDNDKFTQPLLVALGHDSKTIGNPLVEQIKRQVKQNLLDEGVRHITPELFTDRFFQEYRKITFRGLNFTKAGDKLEVGVQRLSNGILNQGVISPEVLDIDPHLVPNLYCPGAYFEITNGTFIVHFPFSMYPDEESARTLPGLVVPRESTGGYKYVVSPGMREKYENNSKGKRKTYFVQGVNELYSIYQHRLELLVLEVFAAYPHIRLARLDFFEEQAGVFTHPDRVQRAGVEFRQGNVFADFQKHISFQHIPAESGRVVHLNAKRTDTA